MNAKESCISYKPLELCLDRNHYRVSFASNF